MKNYFIHIIRTELNDKKNIMMNPHIRMSELFAWRQSSKEEDGNKKLSNILCSFVLQSTDTLELICGIEVDSLEKRVDIEYVKNKAFMKEIFENNSVPLLEVNVDELYDTGWYLRLLNIVEKWNETAKN